MQGTLIRYGPLSANVAFRTGKHPRCITLVGGLTDGLYMPLSRPLSESLDKHGWSLVQAQISASISGWGYSNLDRDADEIALLLRHLEDHEGVTEIVLMGHSTGCQDSVRLAKRHGASLGSSLKAVILQAPVSDREYLETLPELKELAVRAQNMVSEGKGDEILCRFSLIRNHPLTASRFVAMYCRLGDDDMFSSDLTNAELKELLSPLSARPTLLLFSGADEFVPATVAVDVLAQRLTSAAGPLAQAAILPGAKHGLQGSESEAFSVIQKFLDSL